MTPEEFNKLSQRDFTNGAVVDEIRATLKKVATLEHDLTAAQANIAALLEEDRIWEKHSLVQIVRERGELRERVKALTDTQDILKAAIDDGLSALNSSAILLTRVVEAKEALLRGHGVLTVAREQTKETT